MNLAIARRIYPDNEKINKLQESLTHLYNTAGLLNSADTAISYFQSVFSNITEDIDKLIYPQAIISLTDFMILFEPYYYFSGSSGIPAESGLQAINYENKNRNLKLQFKHILKESRAAVLQTNIIAGVPLLSYFNKHLEERAFNPFEKKEIYKLLTSENYYLKLNLSNYIIYNYLKNQDVHAERLYNVFANVNEQNCDSMIAVFNSHFENMIYKLGVIKNREGNEIVLVIKPANIQGVEQSAAEIKLPVPSFNYVYENRVIYPSYLEHLHHYMEKVANKMIKYDIVEKLNTENFINLKLLK